MIYTLTMNPATDYVMILDELKVGEVNRAGETRCIAGGKGVNVAKLLGDCVSIVAKVSRTNVKIHHNECVTEINADSFADDAVIDDVRRKLDEINKGDWLIIGGSLPGGVDADFYAKVTRELTEKGVRVIVDTSGEPLREVVKSSNPWLIAPNEQEYAEIADLEIKCNTLVSMGEKGARLTVGDKVYTCEGEVVKGGYTVGAGDALLAAFVAEFIKSNDYEQSLIAGVSRAAQYIKSHEY